MAVDPFSHGAGALGFRDFPGLLVTKENRTGSHQTLLPIKMQSETSNKAGPAGDFFGRFASQASCLLGSRWAFVTAVLVVAAWGVVGPIFHYSDTWQLVINTATTIITFLMVFLIQNTQNRDARAINLKLNELIHAIKKAKNQMIDIENLSDEELDQLAAIYEGFRLEAECQLPDPATTDQATS